MRGFAKFVPGQLRTLFVSVVVTFLFADSAKALSVTVGAVVINDNNGTTDRNGAAGIILFDSEGGGAGNFAVAQGYRVAGTAKVQASWLLLTDFVCVRNAGAAGGVLPLSLEHTFPALAAGNTNVRLLGQHFNNPNGNTIGGAITTYQASVNAVNVGKLLTFAHSGIVSPQAYFGARGPLAVAAGAWAVKGDFTFDLQETGDASYLPGSASFGDLPPIEDTDVDGVPDEIDVCPNNSPGLPIDTSGRPLLDCNIDCALDGQDIQCFVNELLNQ